MVPGAKFLGLVEDYFAHVGVIATTLKAALAVGDTIRVKGHTTDVTERLESMQIEHQGIQGASKGDSVGIKISGRARKGDALYKL
ncbi:MAG: translation elongation factor-like protein [Elusimicrobia bacterium]|nr:translation elongation factor-like protein [Elusimicrobiota bacterium]